MLRILVKMRHYDVTIMLRIMNNFKDASIRDMYVEMNDQLLLYHFVMEWYVLLYILLEINLILFIHKDLEYFIFI